MRLRDVAVRVFVCGLSACVMCDKRKMRKSYTSFENEHSPHQRACALVGGGGRIVSLYMNVWYIR